MSSRKLCTRVTQAPPDRLPYEGETLGHVTHRGPDYRIDENGCWLWLKSKNKAGYPVGFPKPHHRYWVRATGREIPFGWHVHHTCKVPACVNPEHLELIDPKTHFRHHGDEKRIISVEEAAEIRELAKDQSWRYDDLAERFGISPTHVEDIIMGRRFKELGTEKVIPEGRTCKHCGGPIPEDRRRQAVYCSVEHQRKHSSHLVWLRNRERWNEMKRAQRAEKRRAAA